MKILLKYRTVWIVALTMLLAGCVASGDVDTLKNENMRIRLWAGIDKASVSIEESRGNANSTSGILTPTSNEKLTIGMARIDELYSANYPAFIDCGSNGRPNPIKAELDFPDPNNSYYRDVNFLSSSQFFYTATDIVKFAAWYPWETGVYSSTAEKTTVTFPITGEVDVMYGNVTSGSQTDGFDIMTFDHALCVYRIYVYRMHDDDEDLSWGKLETMTLKSMPNSCTITLPKRKDGAGAKSFGISYAGEQDIELDDPENNIYFNPGNSIPIGLANRHLAAKCISAPPANGLLNISLTTSKTTASQRVSIARNFQAGHAYDIVLRFSDHGLINADVSVEDWIKHDHDVSQEVTVDMFYDLSRYGTANSYIINSANYGYSFDATVKGNGDSSLVGNVDTSVNTGWIDILWSDMPNYNGNPTVQLVSNQLSNHRVLFKVLGNPNDINDKSLKSEGNVILAAYKDSSKQEILWTWHLWITDRVNIHGNPNGYLVQDRNLGAIAAAPENGQGTNMWGLYYQWGRPTPFKGGITLQSTTELAETVDEAVKNPTTLYGNGSSGDWLQTRNNMLWGYQNDFTKAQKTIYDPCPPGYMVADKRVWESVATYQTTNGWNELGAKIEVGGNIVWYPIQGSIGANGSLNQAESGVRMWSSVVDINQSGYPFELRYNSSGNATTTASQYRHTALPVRCVSGHSVEVVTNLSVPQTANSYMIHRSGYYKFKANVRGNGVMQLLATDSDNKTTVIKEIAEGISANIAPAKVDFLWYQGDFCDTNWTTDVNKPNEAEIPMILLDGGVPDKDGYVSFYVGDFHKGNVGLAAYDTSGNILWSWHLWFTDVPKDVTTGNYSLMDRFLGATFAPTISGNSITFSGNQQLATYGFYYQWGKKDPFFGPRTVNATDNTNNNTAQCSTYWVKSYNGTWTARDTFDTAGTVRVSEAHTTPLTFRNRSNSGAEQDAGSHWYTDDFVTSKTSQHMWGYGQVGNAAGQGITKTVHDPCPPGYMVMYHEVWFYNSLAESYANKSDRTANTLSNEDDFHGGGIVLTKSHFDRVWYPFVGRRGGYGGRISDAGSIGYIATCMPRGNYNTRYYYYSKTQTKQDHDNGGGGSAIARVVRCMKE